MKYPAPHLISFLQLTDATGTLVTTQDENNLPFEVKRVFWVYGTPVGKVRGGHAHRTTQEVLTVVNGSVRVETQHAEGQQVFELTTPTQGLYIPPLCWIKVQPSEGAVICCLTSTLYDEADYIRQYEEFLQLLN
ncbi:sugar 3,4-ketoisomerase [Rufibacter roseus]|uniref:Sugar 3,4-ketoisomerase n=1 Tax=Rufibacter roseus TaxID=1567108 RepID=A0ABW2DIG9_9BACT|nr:FdtA/QdtA family cupin domain-containing protein [Rufibacter roseus]